MHPSDSEIAEFFRGLPDKEGLVSYIKNLSPDAKRALVGSLGVDLNSLGIDTDNIDWGRIVAQIEEYFKR